MVEREFDGIWRAVQAELEGGEWTQALSRAREGARDLKERLITLLARTTPRDVPVEEAAPVAQPLEAPTVSADDAA